MLVDNIMVNRIQQRKPVKTLCLTVRRLKTVSTIPHLKIINNLHIISSPNTMPASLVPFETSDLTYPSYNTVNVEPIMSTVLYSRLTPSSIESARRAFDLK